ncbi:MAG: double zinc ribbon domain-containing protein [Chloroflexota bacterium]
MPVDATNLSNLFLALTAWGAAFLIALWIGLIVWTYRDIRARTRDSFLRVLAAVLVLLLFIPGVVVYLLLRPPRTLEDEYQQTLEEEALLQAVEDSPLCPGCGRRVKELWIVCPSCHTKLKKPCHACGKLMELPWNLCPYCGAPTPGMRREGMTMDEALRTLPVTAETADGDGEAAV